MGRRRRAGPPPPVHVTGGPRLHPEVRGSRRDLFLYFKAEVTLLISLGFLTKFSLFNMRRNKICPPFGFDEALFARKYFLTLTCILAG